MPRERLEPHPSVRAVVGWFPAFLFLACPAPSQPEDHLGCLATPLLPEMLSARRSCRVEVARRACLYLCVFQTAQVKLPGRPKPLGWRQRWVESRRVCLFLGPFQMARREPLAQAKSRQQEMREVFPRRRDGLAVSLFQVP